MWTVEDGAAALSSLAATRTLPIDSVVDEPIFVSIQSATGFTARTTSIQSATWLFRSDWMSVNPATSCPVPSSRLTAKPGTVPSK